MSRKRIVCRWACITTFASRWVRTRARRARCEAIPPAVPPHSWLPCWLPDCIVWPSSLLAAKSPQASPGTNTSSLDKPPRPLTPEERAFLERLHGGRSFEGVKVDEGFLFDSWVGGVVRSDKEINVQGEFSLMNEKEQLALLAHESTHIVQRQLGTLDNFRGAFAHAWARLTGTDLYAIPADFKGSFFDLNFEQQAVVVENAARIKLDLPLNGYGAALGKVRVFQLYKEYLETVAPR